MGNSDMIPAFLQTNDIGKLIHTVRGQQVMLDSDLAMLYGYEVKTLNQQVKRNICRFPEDFMFQLTKDELINLKSQIVTSSWGGTRKLPFAFTEQGIYMLATVLKGEVAEQQSIFIMRAFREMRHFVTNNSLLFEKISHVELKQLEYQRNTDEKFDRVFKYIEDHAESEQKIFFDGQIYDAFSILTSIIQKAQTGIILIDGYVDTDTLNILTKKNSGVEVKLYTLPSAKLTEKDVANFNAQYPTLTVKKTKVFHDRFLIIDARIVYHIGASLKDAGKKCFGLSKMDDEDIISDLLARLKLV